MTLNTYTAFELSPTTSANSTTKTVSVPSMLGVFNVGPNEAFLMYGSGAQTATTTVDTGYKVAIPAGAYREFEIGLSNGFSAICASGSATLRCNLGVNRL